MEWYFRDGSLLRAKYYGKESKGLWLPTTAKTPKPKVPEREKQLVQEKFDELKDRDTTCHVPTSFLYSIQVSIAKVFLPRRAKRTYALRVCYANGER